MKLSTEQETDVVVICLVHVPTYYVPTVVVAAAVASKRETDGLMAAHASQL